MSRPATRRTDREEEELRVSRRRGWALAGYSASLLVFAGVLTAFSSSGEIWRAYGLACLVFGGIVGMIAAVLLLRERGLIEASGRLIHQARTTTVRTRQGFTARRVASVERRHPGERTIGGLPGMSVTQFRVIRSEWTKLYSVRSTRITLLVALGIIVGIAALVAGVAAAQWDNLNPIEQARFRPGTDPLGGVGLAQLAVGVLGVLTGSSEYATGMVRTTFSAVPRRLPVIWAKLVVLCVLIGPSALVAMVASFWLAQVLLAKEDLDVGLGEPYVWHVIFNGPVYLMLVAAMGLGLGMLLRHTAGAISSLVGILFLLPIVFALLPGDWSRDVGPYLFGAAGQAFWSPPGGGVQITSSLAAFVVVLAWVGTVFAAACYRLLRDDA